VLEVSVSRGVLLFALDPMAPVGAIPVDCVLPSCGPSLPQWVTWKSCGPVGTVERGWVLIPTSSPPQRLTTQIMIQSLVTNLRTPM